VLATDDFRARLTTRDTSPGEAGGAELTVAVASSPDEVITVVRTWRDRRDERAAAHAAAGARCPAGGLPMRGGDQGRAEETVDVEQDVAPRSRLVLQA